MRTIYLDSLFILNFIIDYIIVLAAGKICALPLRRRRMAAAAAAGGLYAVLAVMFPSVLALPVVKLCVGAVIPLAAFGQGRHYPRAAISFFAVSAGFAGAVYAISGLGGAILGGGSGNGGGFGPDPAGGRVSGAGQRDTYRDTIFG